MRRVCTTQPGDGVCCRAFSQGVRSGQTFTFTTRNGQQKCGACSVIQRTKGRGPGFQFRFHRGSECGLIHGCAALQQAGGGQMLQLPPPGGAGTLAVPRV